MTDYTGVPWNELCDTLVRKATEKNEVVSITRRAYLLVLCEKTNIAMVETFGEFWEV